MNDPEYLYEIESLRSITTNTMRHRLVRRVTESNKAVREVVIPWSNEEEFKAILALMDPKPMQHRFFY